MKFRIATILTIILAFGLSLPSFAQRPGGGKRPDGVGGKRPDGMTRPDGTRRPDGVGGKRPDGATPGQRPSGVGRPRG
ncbi:MAG: hypothetical protein U0Y68_04660 [Blastocatellia bacterium]